jgi:hypothetical protein
MHEFWEHFDWGGFLGAVLGAIAAGLGVVYSLRKTAEFDKKRDEQRKAAVRRIVLAQGKLSVSNIAHTTAGLSAQPPKNATPLQWWKQIEPQTYVIYPTAVSANLPNMNLLFDKEIEATLSFHQSMSQYCQSLEKCRDSKEEEEFLTRFEHFLWKRRNIISDLRELFQIMGPLEKFGDVLVLTGIETLERTYLPEIWKRASWPPKKT